MSPLGFAACQSKKCTNQARSAPTKQNRYSPTESTEPTELLAECILPQIYTEVRLSSRGCTCLKCTNRARSAPTEQNRYSPTESTELTELLAERILPQISQICTDGLGAFKGVHLSQVHQRNKGHIYIARLVHFLFWQAAKPSGDKCTP